MNRTITRAGLLTAVLTLFFHVSLLAQEAFERHEFSAHIGYGVLTHHPPTLTLRGSDYESNLSKGIGWDAHYLFRPIPRFIFGALYSGFSSKGSHTEGSDHLWTHTLATQIGLCNARSARWHVRLTAGPGVVFVRNNSRVFDRPRKVKASTIAIVTNAGLHYKLNKQVGVGIDVQYIYSGLARMQVDYHGEKTHVRLSKQSSLSYICPLNILAGASYYF